MNIAIESAQHILAMKEIFISIGLDRSVLESCLSVIGRTLNWSVILGRLKLFRVKHSHA